MGRLIRRVPPNWKHPERPAHKTGSTQPNLQPMHDQRFEDGLAEWLADFDRIRAGNLTGDERLSYPGGFIQWLNSTGEQHDPDFYRPWRDEEATWYQLWETVTVGTPVSPPFATKEELADYLAEHGDFWDQSRWREAEYWRQHGINPDPPAWGKERAYKFVMEIGSAPSLGRVDGKLVDGVIAVTQSRGPTKH
jgi:hypothetical protein